MLTRASGRSKRAGRAPVWCLRCGQVSMNACRCSTDEIVFHGKVHFRVALPPKSLVADVLGRNLQGDAGLGRPSARGRTQAEAWSPHGSTPLSAGARPPLPRARDAARDGRVAITPPASCVRRRSRGAWRGMPQRLPGRPVQHPARSRAPPRRGGHGAALHARATRAGDPHRQGRQPRAPAPRARLGGSLPRPASSHAARGAECARLRAEQRAQTPAGCEGRRRVLLRELVRRLDGCARHRSRTGTRRDGANVACTHRMETRRTDSLDDSPGKKRTQ